MSALGFSEFIDNLARDHRGSGWWYGRLSVTLEGPGVFEWAQLHMRSGPYPMQFGRLAVVHCQVSQSINHYGQEVRLELMYPGPGTGGDDPVPNTIMAVLALTGALLELPDFHLLSNCHMNITAQRELMR